MISFRTRSARRVAPQLYGAIVAAARSPGFYRVLGVADTVEGRYEMIVLHIALFLRRLKDPGAPGRDEAQAISQATIDFMAADLDRSIREMGVGDLSVSRYMKRLGEGLYGRAAAYDSALDQPGRSTLLEALLRNVYGGHSPGGQILAAIADYVYAQRQHLAGQPNEKIRAGQINFIQPDRFLS